MKGKEYLKNREVVADMRKKLLEQNVILTDCYYWKDVYEALRLEREETLKEVFDKFDKFACIKDDKWYKDFKSKLNKRN